MAKDSAKKRLPDAGAWAIIHCAETGKFLLGKRSPIMNRAGAWNFFGGRLDEGEEPRDALVRELAEEAGIRIKQKQLIKLCRVAGSKTGSQRQLHYYLLQVEREVAPRLNQEHSHFRWFRRNRLPRSFNRPTQIAIKQGLLHMACER